MSNFGDGDAVPMIARCGHWLVNESFSARHKAFTKSLYVNAQLLRKQSRGGLAMISTGGGGKKSYLILHFKQTYRNNKAIRLEYKWPLIRESEADWFLG